MRNKNFKCIILGHKKFGENDKLIFLYNKELGKFKAIAKGSRKITSKFTGHLETFTLCDLSLYFGPKNIIISEINSIHERQQSKQNFENISALLQIAEITNKMLFENQNIENLDKLLQKTKNHLSISQKPFLIIIAYIIKLMDTLGLIPDFKEINTKLEKKYLKLFHFLKTQNFSSIEKINLSPKEKEKTKVLIQNLLSENHINSNTLLQI